MAFEANRPLPTFGPKMADPVNFRSAPRIFVKFCTVRGTSGYMKSILMVFLKKFMFRAKKLL